MAHVEETSLPTSTVHRGVLRAMARDEPRNIVRLVDSIERDYQFRLGYLVIQSLIQSSSVEVTIDPLPSDPLPERARRLAENLGTIWAQSLPHSVRAFAFGRAAFERTYEHDAAINLYLVEGLDPLPPEVTEMAIDAEGRFAGIELRAGETELLLEPERSWWFALDQSATCPHGRSRYVGAPYEIWKARRQLDEQERIWYAKFAIGHGVARAPDMMAGDADPMDVMRGELSTIESGGILILSSRTGPDGKYLYDYQESEGQRDSKPLEERRRMLDVAALRSLGIPERAITQNDHSGSRAVAQVHLEVLYRTCEGILDQLVSSFEKYIVRPAVRLNWPANAMPTFRVRYRPIGEDAESSLQKQNAELARTLALASDIPPLVREAKVDISRLFADAGIPQRPADEVPAVTDPSIDIESELEPGQRPTRSARRNGRFSIRVHGSD